MNRRTDDPGSAYPKVSPTGAIMMLLPVLVAACWFGVLGVLISDWATRLHRHGRPMRPCARAPSRPCALVAEDDVSGL